jgi:alkenylglycerophosphocholine/alkenylglycerophosphoethanolamine hydrolase
VGPVLAYLLVISAMVASAIGSGDAWAMAGALLFFASDGTLAWNKFVSPFKGGRLAVIVTYHLGQLGLVLSLLP